MRLDLRPNEVRESLGLTTDTSRKGISGRTNRTPLQTHHEILKTLQKAGRPMTRLEISRALGRSKTPHLINQIEYLAQSGFIARETVVAVNGCYAHAYRL